MSKTYLPFRYERKKFLPYPQSRLVHSQYGCVNDWWSALRFFGKICSSVFSQMKIPLETSCWAMHGWCRVLAGFIRHQDISAIRSFQQPETRPKHFKIKISLCELSWIIVLSFSVIIIPITLCFISPGSAEYLRVRPKTLRIHLFYALKSFFLINFISFSIK